MLLENKVAVIYGAGGPIGGAVARAFAREGARVFLAGRTRASLDKVAAEIRSNGGVADTAVVDALDEHAQRYGAEGVDAILAGIAHTLRSNIRPYDALGRQGENRLGVLLVQTTSGDAYLWAEKLRKQIAGQVITAGSRSLTASYGGYVGSDTFATSVSGAPSLTTTAILSSPVGPYPITAAVGTLASTNYSFNFVNGTLTVTAAADTTPPTVTSFTMPATSTSLGGRMRP